MFTRAAQSLVGLVTAIALAAGPVAAQSAQPASHPPLFQMRMASETPQPGFERREQLMGGIPAYLSPVDVLSDNMIRQITVKKTEDELILHVHFSEEGRRRLETATQERASSHMALLMDSHLVVFAEIRDTLSRGDAIIGLKLPPDKLEHYRKKIAERWPPSQSAVRSQSDQPALNPSSTAAIASRGCRAAVTALPRTR
ncbi:MAG: SecDF P1 head subdomain-containing protein [Gemmatimonadaceae bacterium]